MKGVIHGVNGHNSNQPLVAGFSALTVLLLVFSVVMPWHIPTAAFISAWGVATFALVPPLQIRVRTDPAATSNVASALNSGAFNFDNAVGAVVGRGVISLELGNPMIATAGQPCRRVA